MGLGKMSPLCDMKVKPAKQICTQSAQLQLRLQIWSSGIGNPSLKLAGGISVLLSVNADEQTESEQKMDVGRSWWSTWRVKFETPHNTK